MGKLPRQPHHSPHSISPFRPFRLTIYKCTTLLSLLFLYFQLEVETDDKDVVVLSSNDEDDDMQEVADMASIGVVEGLISGMLEPQVDEEKMKQKFCNIFHTILEGYQMVKSIDS